MTRKSAGKSADAAAQDAPRVVVAALGLACWIVTLTLHTGAVTPFQRFAGLGAFVGSFAPQSLAAGMVVAAAVALAALRGRSLRNRMLLIAGAVLYGVADTAFAALALAAVEPVAPVAITGLAVVAGAGSVASGLVWGRVYKGFLPRQSLTAVGLAGVMAAVVGLLIAWVPAVPCAVLFVACALAAVGLPAVCGLAEPHGDAPAAPDGARRSPGERLRSFAAVALPALLGLLAFAFVVGTMRGTVVESHPFHLMALAVDGLVLGALAVVRTRRPMAAVAYRGLIPALAVLLLTVTNISMALFGGSWVDMAMTYLLYTLAALLTLATLSAVAHAGEFPSDFVYGMPFALFCLASLVGLGSSEVMSEEAVQVSTTVITAIYAFAMVLIPGLRAQRLELGGEEDPLGLDGPAPALAGDSAQKQAVRSEGAGSGGTLSLADRCATLAREYRLTAREAEILGYLAAGYGSGYISEALYISPNTVRTHVHNIYGKLGVGSREDVLDLVKGDGR